MFVLFDLSVNALDQWICYDFKNIQLCCRSHPTTWLRNSVFEDPNEESSWDEFYFIY
jgi:hypothetical protein